MTEEKTAISSSDTIKKYINLYKEAETEEEKAARKGGKRNSSTKYEVILSSGLDAVIKRTNKMGEKDLVIMPSQNKYFFKDDIFVQNVEDVDETRFKEFFDRLPDEGLEINNVVFDTIEKGDAYSLRKMLTKPECRELLHNGLLSFPLYKNTSLYNIISMDPQLWRYMVNKTPILSTQTKYDANFCLFAQLMHKERSYDEARMFIDAYTKSSMTGITMGRSYYYSVRPTASTIPAMKELDTKRLVEYLCFDLYEQGFDTIELYTYEDYLRNSKDFDGKIKDKYPASLLTAHDVICAKVQEAKEIIDKRKFALMYEELKSLFDTDDNTLFTSEGISLIVPNEPNDLINEGRDLGHCVGSYIHRVAEGECVILFARNTSAKDVSYLTVELCPVNEYGETNYCIQQIQGANVRTKLTDKEKKFFKKFMKETGFTTNNINLIEK